MRGEERIVSIGIWADRRDILGTGIVDQFFYSMFSMSDLICLLSLLNHFSVPEMGRNGNSIDDFIDRHILQGSPEKREVTTVKSKSVLE